MSFFNKSLKKKVLFTTCMFVLIMLVISGCSTGNSPKTADPSEELSNENPLVIKWGSQNIPVMASGKTSLYTVEEIEKRSEGKIKVDYYDQGKLGYDAELIEQVIDGTLPVATVGLGIFSQYTPLLEAVQLPFLITTYEKEYEAVKSLEFRALLDAAGEEVGLKLIGTQENGIRHFANNVKPINNVEDLQGLKIRVPQTEILTTTMEKLGANPIPLAYNEVYTALQNKVVDGEEINFTSIEGQKHYEVLKYISTIGMYPYCAVTAINLEFWNSLPSEAQDIIEKALIDAEEKNFTGWIQENDKEARKVAEDAGVIVNEIENLEPFRNATQELYDRYKEMNPLIKDFVEMAEKLE